jgi:adenosylmethionine-8-amino-7-oxononanoate aminotransferase
VRLGLFPAESRMGHRVALACRAEGVILRNLGDAVVLMPPLGMSPDQIRTCVGAIGIALRRVLSAP